MQFVSNYDSPLGKILLASDEEGLIGLRLEGQKYYAASLLNPKEEETDYIKDAKNWLNIYFKGKNPEFTPKIHFIGTPFQISVWKILEKIPYGKLVTYGDIAERIAKEKNVEKMSARAIGSAVGHNKISVIIPCHRVIGKDGSLTGYAGGIQNKIKLLELENITVKNNYGMP